MGAIVGNYSESEKILGGYLTSVSIGSETMRTTGGDSKRRRSLTTNCTKDSPLTVYVPNIPTAAGCYPKVADRKSGTGIYDSSTNGNPSIVQYVISAEQIQNGGSSDVSSGICWPKVFAHLHLRFPTVVPGKKKDVLLCFVVIVLRLTEGNTHRTARDFSIS